MSFGAGTSTQQPFVPLGVPFLSCGTWEDKEGRQDTGCHHVPKDTVISVLIIRSGAESPGYQAIAP